LTKHVGFVFAYVKKAKNRKIDKVLISWKSKTHYRQWNTRPISVCVFQDALL